VYTIQSGDTLYSIAQQFGVTLDDLVALNNIENPDSIRAGDQLFIPPPE
ncbi:MAG: LysM peptidoglycan-binding domain-containing protein, partial [Acidimicrobiia bacterium]|nr:LysM peptidoglycan-binding domain-containing protein [Acidimicrobiia bacterium]